MEGKKDESKASNAMCVCVRVFSSKREKSGWRIGIDEKYAYYNSIRSDLAHATVFAIFDFCWNSQVIRCMLPLFMPQNACVHRQGTQYRMFDNCLIWKLESCKRSTNMAYWKQLPKIFQFSRCVFIKDIFFYRRSPSTARNAVNTQTKMRQAIEPSWAVFRPIEHSSWCAK